jgi:hypothetical protein
LRPVEGVRDESEVAEAVFEDESHGRGEALDLCVEVGDVQGDVVDA